MAGTTVAKYLLLGGTGLTVGLVEPNHILFNIMSNMVLTGERTLNQLAYNYNNIGTNFGVKLLNNTIASIDRTGKKRPC